MNSKHALRVVVLKGVAMVPKNIHLYFTDGAATMSPFSPYASLLMPKSGQ